MAGAFACLLLGRWRDLNVGARYGSTEMWLIVVIAIVALVAGLLVGGDLRAFEQMKLHWWGLAVAGLALQWLPAPILPMVSARAAAALGLVASYALLLLVLALNRRVPAAPVMTLGLLLNVAVVGANAGMPVSEEAIRSAGGSASDFSVESNAKHHLMTDEDVLRGLGDVVPIPPPVGVVISVGDVFLYGGMAWFLFQVTRGRSRMNPRPLAMWFPSYRGKHAPDHWRLSSRNRSTLAEVEQRGSGP